MKYYCLICGKIKKTSKGDTCRKCTSDIYCREALDKYRETLKK